MEKKGIMELVSLKKTPVRKPPEEKVEPAVKPVATSETPSTTDVPEDSKPIFQAVGVIRGAVKVIDKQLVVTIRDLDYPLAWTPGKKQSFEALKINLKKSPLEQYSLLVYPKVTHFPGRDKDHLISFQLLAFAETAEKLGLGLRDFEFKLCGLWQFIPVCKTPCITIQKNFTKDRLAHIKDKDTDVARKVRFLKASHIPVLWRDSVVKPFRFNPRLAKEGADQGKPHFVQIKAKFIPSRKVFGFDSLIALPTEDAPKSLKASKKDKQAVRNNK